MLAFKSVHPALSPTAVRDELVVLQNLAPTTLILRDYQVAIRESPAARWDPVYRFGQVLLEPGASVRLFTGGKRSPPDLSMRRPLSVLNNAEVAILDPKGQVVAQVNALVA